VCQKRSFLLPGKIKGDLYRFDVAESKCSNENALSSTMFKGGRFNVKNYFF